MTQAGPLSPTLAVKKGVGINWLNQDNIKTENAVYAQASVARRTVSDTLDLVSYHYDFAIPADATINGIKLEIKRYGSIPLGGSLTDLNVALTLDAGDNPYGSTADSNSWNGVNQYYTWGSSTELWGVAWTPADINSDSFGAMQSATLGGSATTGCTAYVDHHRITVYYTEAATGIITKAMMGVGL
jgi:hypothetical protein